MFGSRSARIAALVAAGVLGFGGMAAAGSPSAEEFLEAALEDATGEIQEIEEIEESTDESEATQDDAEESTEVAEESTEVAEQTEETEETEESTDEPEESTEEIEETAEAEVLGVTEVLAEESGSGPELSDPDESTEFNESYCVPGNHGKTVSAVARGVFDPDDAYPGDVTVKMAAQSSCGKLDALPDEIPVEEPAIEEPAVEESEVEVPVVEEPAQAEERTERPGKRADGQGNGNGKSNGNGNGKSNGNGNGNGNGKRGG